MSHAPTTEPAPLRSSATVPVSIVIVTWNSTDYIAPCLESIARLVRPPEKIVVLDNASTDDTLQRIRGVHQPIDLVALYENTGFCHAANVGIARTRSPFVLVLNPDTRLTPSFLEVVLPAFDDPRVGIAGGKLLRFDGVTIDSAGQSLGRSRQPLDRGYGRLDTGHFDRDEQVFGMCGAAVVYRRAMIHQIERPTGEFFDEEFFAFYEDLDVAWRARKLGWVASYRHRAVAHHDRGGSANTSAVRRRWGAFLNRPDMIRFHIAKNRYLTILRNDRTVDYLANLPFILTRDFATMGAILIFSPRLIPRLIAARSLFRRALDARRRDLEARAAS